MTATEALLSTIQGGVQGRHDHVVQLLLVSQRHRIVMYMRARDRLVPKVRRAVHQALRTLNGNLQNLLVVVAVVQVLLTMIGRVVELDVPQSTTRAAHRRERSALNAIMAL